MTKMQMIALVVVSLLCASHAEGQARELDGPEAALAMAIARVCANEGGLRAEHPADCALIYQATRRHGDTARERLDWLAAHSSCVLTSRALTEDELVRGNCRWSRYLADSDATPQEWPAGWSWDRAIPRWAAMRRFCRGLVAGRTPADGWPCAEDPDTWGGAMDRVGALAAGMRALRCEGTLNAGYRYARPRGRSEE